MGELLLGFKDRLLGKNPDELDLLQWEEQERENLRIQFSKEDPELWPEDEEVERYISG